MGSTPTRNIYDGLFQRTAFAAGLFYFVLVAIWRKYSKHSNYRVAHRRYTLLSEVPLGPDAGSSSIANNNKLARSAQKLDAGYSNTFNGFHNCVGGQ